MKRMLFAGAVAFAVASPALAADLIQPPPPPQAPATYVPAAPPAFNWSGIYIGVNGGYAFGNSNWSGDPAIGFPGTGNFDVNGWLVGGTLGANWQTGQFVLGVETDGDWTDLNGNLAGTGATCGIVAPCTFQTSNNWLATFRGRLGFAFDRVLVYGTAGGAAGDVQTTLTGVGLAGPFTSVTNSTEWGWTAGAGIEYAITDNVTAKVEYLFVDLANGSATCPAGACAMAATTTAASFDTSLIRGGVNFKFGGF